MSKNRSSLEIWLEKAITDSSPGSQLPHDAELARQFKISLRTVTRTMKPFVSRGLIERIQGKGTFIPGPSPAPEPVKPNKETAAEQLAGTIFKSICSGEYRRGDSMPSIKYVSLQYGVAPRTVSSAYGILCRQGHLCRVGKSFRIGTFRSADYPERKKTVYLFNWESSDFTDVFRDDMFAFAFPRLEKELITSGYRMIFKSTLDLTDLVDQWAHPGKEPDGLIFFHQVRWRWPAAEKELIRYCRKTDRMLPPTAIDWKAGYFKTDLDNCRLFSRRTAITQSTRTLARFIVSRQFKDVVFFTGQSRPAWRFLFNPFPLFRIYQELWALDKTIRTRMLVRPGTRKFHSGNTLEQEIDRVLESVRESEPKNLGTPYDQIRESIRIGNPDGKAFKEYADADLWVFGSDDEAEKALQWAETQNISIPGDLQIIGLEDNPAFYQLGLSCCRPDWDNLGYLMAHAVIGDFPLPKTTRGFIRSNALLLEKQTTR